MCIRDRYGFGSKVVSIFHPGYRNTAHTFIKSLAKGIDTKKILYFETTVEPQYMGAIALCYSDEMCIRDRGDVTPIGYFFMKILI